MVLLEVGIPTGFSGDLAGTQQINTYGNGYKYEVKRIELADRKMVFYFDSLPNDGNDRCVAVRLTRTMAVNNAKQPTARVYDYYAPRHTNVAEFTFSGIDIAHTLDTCQDIRLNIPCPTFVVNY